MAIQSITLRQGNENHITDVEMTLKQINYATTYTTKPDINRLAYYNALQRTDVENCGKAQGKNVSLSKNFLNKYNILGATAGNGVRN